jgi:hypothetical protein
VEDYEWKARNYREEIELAKQHEARGKIGCQCWHCEEKKGFGSGLADPETEDQEKKSTAQEECPECGKRVQELDEENGICGKCVRKFSE